MLVATVYFMQYLLLLFNTNIYPSFSLYLIKEDSQKADTCDGETISITKIFTIAWIFHSIFLNLNNGNKM